MEAVGAVGGNFNGNLMKMQMEIVDGNIEVVEID